MKVILVNPCLGDLEMISIKRKVPPLSLAYIASLLRKDNIDAEIIDANAYSIDSESDFWTGLKADVFIITTSPIDTWQCPHLDISGIKHIVKRIRQSNPPSRIIINGPHGTTNPEKVIGLLGDVIVVRNEPECTTSRIISLMKNNHPYGHVAGISFMEKRRIISNRGINTFNSFLDDLPAPAYDLLPMDRYEYVLMGKNFSIMEASRGCPHKCSFCLKVMYPSSYKTRKTEHIINEVKELTAVYGVKNIEFMDLEFCVNKRNVKGLCREIIGQGIRFRWAASTRFSSVDRELLEEMRDAGCCLIQYGFESGSRKILDAMNKDIPQGTALRAVRETRRAGIRSLLYVMVGNPGEDDEDIEKTINLLKDLRPNYISVVAAIPYPGTELYRQLCKNNPDYIFENACSEQVKRRIRRIYMSFYLDPRYILRELAAIRSFRDLKIAVSGFLDYLIPLLKKTLD